MGVHGDMPAGPELPEAVIGAVARFVVLEHIEHLHFRVNAQLSIDVVDMRFCGSRSDVEIFGNVGGRLSTQKQRQYIFLSIG